MLTNLAIGLRNLRRRRLRTSLTGSMILVGTALIVFSVGWAEGVYSDMVALATRSYAGHFQVVARGYEEKPSLFKTVDDPAETEAALERNPFVEAVTARVETAGLLAAGPKTTGVMLVGLEPEKEKKVTTLAGALKKGRWLEAPLAGRSRPMILGSGVARRLEVDLGHEVSFVGQAADGSIAAELFTVTGILETGADELDGQVALIRLDDAQALLVLGRRVHRLVGLAESLNKIEAVRRGVALEPGLRFMSWSEVMPTLERTIRSDRAGLWIFLFIILAVVVLGVTNTMMMAVLERTREFGVMKALGASPGRVVGLVVGESAWISFFGVLFGLGLGVVLVLIVRKWGISFGDEPLTYGGVVIKVMRAELNLVGALFCPLLIFFSGLAAGLLPALRAARLKPAEALRQI